MTDQQQHDRAERIGIMIYCGKETQEEAKKYCDERPWIYGFSDQDEKQDKLF